jgi:hypothetical protein
MFIFDILKEAKFSKEKKYFYHGTGGAYLRSILKHGLIPNKSEDGYGSDEIEAYFHIPQTPLYGVYMSKDKQAAITAAKEISFKTKSPEIIVVIKAQERETIIDEDYVSASIHHTIDVNLKKLLNEHDYEISDDVFYDFVKEQVKMCLKIIEEKMVTSSNKKHYEKLKPYLEKDLKEYITVIVDSAIEQQPADIKREQDKLTRRLRTLNYGENPSKSVRIDKQIGFSGATKIVGILNLNSGVYWGDIGDLIGTYQVKHPMQILQ